MLAELPLQAGEDAVRRLAGPARLDMGRLLAGALDPIVSNVALVGLAGTAQQLLWLDQRLASGESDQIKAGWQVLQAAGQIAHPGMRQRVATVRDRLAALRA